jgi:hypothetical protein
MCLGFTAIYCVRHYEKYKETGRKINKRKHLESNPQGQASYSKKALRKEGIN